MKVYCFNATPLAPLSLLAFIIRVNGVPISFPVYIKLVIIPAGRKLPLNMGFAVIGFVNRIFHNATGMHLVRLCV